MELEGLEMLKGIDVVYVGGELLEGCSEVEDGSSGSRDDGVEGGQ